MTHKPIYVQGMRLFPAHEKAPSFVKGTLLITPNVLVQFCKENQKYMSEYKGEKQLKCQILEGDTGLYFTVDTYVKGDKKEPKEPREDSPYVAPEDNSDLPF